MYYPLARLDYSLSHNHTYLKKILIHKSMMKKLIILESVKNRLGRYSTSPAEKYPLGTQKHTQGGIHMYPVGVGDLNLSRRHNKFQSWTMRLLRRQCSCRAWRAVTDRDSRHRLMESRAPRSDSSRTRSNCKTKVRHLHDRQRQPGGQTVFGSILLIHHR